VQEPSRSE